MQQVALFWRFRPLPDLARHLRRGGAFSASARRIFPSSQPRIKIGRKGRAFGKLFLKSSFKSGESRAAHNIRYCFLGPLRRGGFVITRFGKPFNCVLLCAFTVGTSPRSSANKVLPIRQRHPQEAPICRHAGKRGSGNTKAAYPSTFRQGVSGGRFNEAIIDVADLADLVFPS